MYILTINAIFMIEQETVCNFNEKPFAYRFYLIKNKSINKTIA